MPKKPSTRKVGAASDPKSTGKKSIKALDANNASKARTIVFVHGIGNKPPPDILKFQWDKALLGFDLGERSRMAYWVNRELHGPPLGPGLDPDEVAALAPKPMAGTFSVKARKKAHIDPKAEAAMARIRMELAAHTADSGFSAKILPLPGFARGWITRAVTSWWLEDVHDFLFDAERRKIMRESLITRLKTGGGPFVIVAHSQGTMIAYDVLANWSGPAIEVDLLITLGSPLGLTEVQDQLKRLTNQKKLATPAMVQRWENYAASGDPVALDKALSNDYKASAGRVQVVDHKVKNPVRSNAHSGIGYLSLKEVRDVVLKEINTSLFQPVAEFTVAKNLNRDMTATDDGVRHRVLIELQDQKPAPHLHVLTDGLQAGEDTGYVSLEDSRKSVVAWIREQAIQAMDIKIGSKAKGPTDKQLKAIDDEVQLEALHAYVSAHLTRPEIERLSATLRNASVFRIFKNSTKTVHVRDSINTVQAHTAHLGYDAKGQGVTWAVLDSGVDWGHPHFALPGKGTVIDRVFECSRRSNEPEIVNHAATQPKDGAPGWDGNGHGTHVAGIIAGGIDKLGIRGIAPSTRLWCYKVLDDQGEGGDSKIIKALDHIYRANNNAPSLRVHGVNLSLGGPFDAEVFGCGDTPLCKSLRKLWRQGVVVVVSAGNEGIVEVPGAGALNMDLSIGDPANLDECVVVGSVHTTKPHLYGVSYFSSRGPTADGRAKPDIVAPGEKILSCFAGGRGETEEALYTRMSGTSMAAPHISGVAACFLSARTEFKGYPDKVKAHMMLHATDLARDRMHQGAGLVNLVKMLINT